VVKRSKTRNSWESHVSVEGTKPCLTCQGGGSEGRKKREAFTNGEGGGRRLRRGRPSWGGVTYLAVGTPEKGAFVGKGKTTPLLPTGDLEGEE